MSKKFILCNLFLFLSLITVGQIYKAEKKLSPGVTKTWPSFWKNVNGIFFHQENKTLKQYRNGVLSSFPNLPIKVVQGDTSETRNIEIFDGKIYLAGIYENFNGSGSDYGLVCFDGSNWKPVNFTLNMRPYNLTQTKDYLYISDGSLLYKMDKSQTFTKIKTAPGHILALNTINTNDFVYTVYNYPKIYKYNGSNFDSVAVPYNVPAAYRGTGSGDSTAYFCNGKYIFKVDKSFKFSLVDSSTDGMKGFNLLGVAGDYLYLNYYTKQMAFNLKTKTYEEVFGLDALSNYYFFDYGKMYGIRWEQQDAIYMELEDGVFVSGSVYEDLNKNCAKNTGERPTTQLKINFKDTINSYLSIANDTGYYQMVVLPGKYDVNVERKYTNTKYDTCGGNKTFNMGIAYNANIPFNLTPNIKDIGAYIVGSIGFVARRGFTQTYQINYENYGSTTENFTFELEYPDSVTFKSSSITPVSHVGTKLTFTVNNVKKLERGKITLEFEVHSKKQINSRIKYICNTFSKTGDSDTTNNTDTLEQRVVTAYDPNLKQSFPEGVIEKPVSKIRYHIHFQNEGNYYASKVTVVDTFDGKMPLIKLQMLGAKHPYTMRVEKGNVIIWEFNNINLQPKSDNEEGSKGFISFEAPLSRPMAIGEKIQNRAHIYFDYEDAITTPYAIVSMGKDPGTVKPVFDVTHKIKVYPNPASTGFNITGETQLGEIAIFNTLGEMMYLANTNSLSENINTETWATGIYFIKFLDKGLGLKVVKI